MKIDAHFFYFRNRKPCLVWFKFRICIIIIIIILVFSFMQDIYNYTPETNHVSRVYCVAAVLYLQFVLHVMLLRP